MKFRSLFLLVIAAVLALASPRRAEAVDVSFSFFYENLSPHGEWLDVGDYGYCWRPTGVDADWAPYADGYWAYTDGGWTWVSYEDFGGIVYHYGRWVRVEDEGWCWVPDYEWAPAWVSWRNNDNHVGWAPLPPEARWERNRGFSVWVDHSYDIAPTSYNFVRTVDFGAPYLRPVLCNRRENVVFVQNTVNITNITYNTGSAVIFNGGPDYGRMNRHVSRQIPALKLVRNTNVNVVNNTIINNNVRVKNVNALQQGNQLVVVAPNVVRPEAAQVTALVKPNVRRTVPQSRVTKGWGTIPADQRTAIRTKFKQETRDLTPETAPARPMKVADVEAVPTKGDPDAPSPTAIRKDRPRPGAPDRDKMTAEREPVTTPTPEPPVANEKPTDPRDPAKIAREKPSRQKATPEPQPAEGVTSPTPGAPVARERVKPARPEVMKPFVPAITNEQPATAKSPAATEVPPKRTAAQQNAEGRERAAAAAREKAAAQQEAARQRGVAQDAAKERATAQQQQEVSPQRQGNEQAQEAARQRSAEAAQDRQKMIQQQQEQNAARTRASDQQDAIRERQAAQQSQEAARERNAQVAAQRQRSINSQQQQQQAAQVRAAQANEARQRAVEQQQSNAGRQQAAERAQMQDAARAQAAQQQQAQAAARAQAQNAARQEVPPPQRQQAPPPQRQQAPPPQRQVVQPQPRQAPAQRTAPGKRQLTPEEAEALKGRR